MKLKLTDDEAVILKAILNHSHVPERNASAEECASLELRIQIVDVNRSAHLIWARLRDKLYERGVSE